MTNFSFVTFKNPLPEWRGHVAFTEKACFEWREKFLVNSDWAPHPEFGKDSRDVLKKLKPPFFPEDEFLIWDPGVDKEASVDTIIVNKVICERLNLDGEGFCFGTDNRMIWGNKENGKVAQVFYREIYDVKTSPTEILLYIKQSTTLKLVFTFPKSSSLQDKNNLHQSNVAEEFDPINLLKTFFELIAKQNSFPQE